MKVMLHIYYKITLGLAIKHLRFIDQSVDYLLLPLGLMIELLATEEHQTENNKINMTFLCICPSCVITV